MEFIKRLFGNKPKPDWDELKKSLELKVEGFRRPAVRLFKTSCVTRSKIGGIPLVEAGSFQWPSSDGRPMTFLAQIDLAEIAKVHRYDWLTDKGILLFFYDTLEMPWGFDPKDRGKWSVLYQENPGVYFEYPIGVSDESKIKDAYLKPVVAEILPGVEEIENLGLSDEEFDLYVDLDDGLDAPRHQVGGYPSPVQGNHMALEAQLASNGVYVGNSKGYSSAEAKLFASGANDWRLLFQFDSDDGLDIMWGDCGMIYFWVQQQKSVLNQFDNSWLILQCS